METPIRRALLWFVLLTISIMAAAWMALGARALQETNGGAVVGACDNGAAKAAKDGGPVGASDDPNCVEGNIQPGEPSCEGLVGALVLSEDSSGSDSDAFVAGNSDGTYLNIVPQPGVSILRTVVKGGDNSNVYDGTDLVGLHSPLNNGGNVPTISHWTICYSVDEIQPTPIKITKIQNGGPAGTEFSFEVVCSMQGGGIGGGYAVTVVGGSMSDLIPINPEYDECTVTEVFENGDGDPWITTYGPAQIPGRVFSQELNPEGVTEYVFENTFIEPDEATVTLTKIGPLDEFGFMIACSNLTDSESTGVILRGGASDSKAFSFEDDDESVECIILEEALVGWTTTVDVTGSENWESGEAQGSTGVRFVVTPGDDISVVFTNTAGYLAQPPTGIPPDLGILAN